MSDDLRIPAPAGRAPISSSYRARRMGPEPGMRAITIAAAALGGLFVVGLASYAVVNRHPSVVPVIEADTRPLRVKPDNPGGMQIAGAEEQGTGDGTDANSRMAPAPEAPAPQALRAQMQQQSTAEAAPAAPPPTAALPATVAPLAAAPTAAVPTATAPMPAAAPPAGTSPLPDTPIRAATPAPARPAPAAGGMQVQLAALESEAAAQAEWQRLSKRMPDLLGDRRLSLQKAERDGHTVWRLRTSGFSDTAEATGFCAKVRAKGGACTIASF